MSGSVTVLVGSGVAAEEESGVPDRFALDAAYPNPFNPATVIPFRVARFARVRLDVVDALGRHVTTLHDADLAPGWYRQTFADARLPSGLYFVVMTTPGFRQSRALALVR